MAQVTGSWKHVTVNGKGPYPVAEDSDPSRDLGGITTERLMNGDGSSRLKAMPKPWKVSGIALSLDDADSSQENLQTSIDTLSDVQMVFTDINNVAYAGTGSIEGDLAKSGQSGTADVTFSGAGKLVKI